VANGQEVSVRINDRGPWGKSRIVDVSYAAAKQLGMHRSGTAKVKLELLN
jgi:rare lipoprotein A